MIFATYIFATYYANARVKTNCWEEHLGSQYWLSSQQRSFQLRFMTLLIEVECAQGRNLNRMNANSPSSCTKSVLKVSRNLPEPTALKKNVVLFERRSHCLNQGRARIVSVPEVTQPGLDGAHLYLCGQSNLVEKFTNLPSIFNETCLTLRKTV